MCIGGYFLNFSFQSSCRVCNGSQPPHVSILHIRNVVYARSLSEVCAARQDVVQVACGCAAHTVFAVLVAPQMFRSHGGSLSRAPSWPSAMHAMAARDHSGVVQRACSNNMIRLCTQMYVQTLRTHTIVQLGSTLKNENV